MYCRRGIFKWLNSGYIHKEMSTVWPRGYAIIGRKMWVCCPFFFSLGHDWRLGAVVPRPPSQEVVPSDLPATNNPVLSEKFKQLTLRARVSMLLKFLIFCLVLFHPPSSPRGYIVLKLFHPLLLGTYIWVCGNEKVVRSLAHHIHTHTHIEETNPVCLCIIILFGVDVCLNHMLM